MAQLYTPEEAAKVLGLSRSRIYLLIATGELESVKIGRARRISSGAIDRFIAALEEGGI